MTFITFIYITLHCIALRCIALRCIALPLHTKKITYIYIFNIYIYIYIYIYYACVKGHFSSERCLKAWFPKSLLRLLLLGRGSRAMACSAEWCPMGFIPKNEGCQHLPRQDHQIPYGCMTMTHQSCEPWPSSPLFSHRRHAAITLLPDISCEVSWSQKLVFCGKDFVCKYKNVSRILSWPDSEKK